MLQNNFENLLSRQLSTKTLKCKPQNPNLKDQLKKYFIQTFELYQKLFSIIKQQKSFYTKPEPLRHPLIFYYGHTAAFFINKFLDKGLISKRINESYQRMFAVGVDQMDWDDLSQSHYDWPSVPKAKQYRNKVKQLVLDLIDKSSQQQITWTSDLWIVMMGIQHERIHLQTSAVIIRRLPINEVTQPLWAKECPHAQKQLTKVPLNSLQKVPSLLKQWNRIKQNTQTYGWDSQFGHKTIDVQEYNSSIMLVSNAEYYEFLNDNGYKKLQYWSLQGKNWLKSTKINKPVFWEIQYINAQKPNYKLRTITNIIQMPWDWPVQVNNLEAQAFCNWKSKKSGKSLRLPTQDEYYALRNILNIDFNDWKQRSVGNINLQYWLSPNPVNMFQTQGFFDIVGNVWQHTVTPIYPFQGFQIHPNYDDFTTPTFDNRHNIIKGGSFISTGNQALYHARYAFRRHFYQFAGFRYVQSNNSTCVKSAQIDQSDQSVQNALRIHFIEPNSYINQIIKLVDNKILKQNIKNSATIGCSVGRLPLQFAKRFKNSYGTDYTARYFQMATRLLQQHNLKYRQVQIQIQQLDLNPQILKNVHLYQMNPQNLDSKKINNIDFILIDGFSIKPNTITKVITNSFKLLSKQEKKLSILLAIDYKNNFIQNISEIMTQNCKQFTVNFQEQINLTKNQSNQKLGKLQYITLTRIIQK